MHRIALENQRHIQAAEPRRAFAQTAQRPFQLLEVCVVQVEQIRRHAMAALEFCGDPIQMTQHKQLPLSPNRGG
jgi:hypothetical protein